MPPAHQPHFPFLNNVNLKEKTKQNIRLKKTPQKPDHTLITCEQGIILKGGCSLSFRTRSFGVPQWNEGAPRAEKAQ